MQEKTRLLQLKFFLLLSPLDRARSVLTDRAICSVAGPCDPAVGVFSTSGLLGDEACPFRNQQSRTWSNLATIVLFGTRGPSLFLVIREGLESCGRLGARGTERLTIVA